ncbi:MAG: acyl-CoA dehydrogenase family protein [Candidatus Aminicenantes bacterium]|nr:acyl-CoA dehydrogenase family protein [Candidatus Aminicenantes bacterium]MDH5468257.1 acyl-CoA dehydrogenase family protein [Candidatus Aminicenantes bacterium]MDH5705603.1 acyl-CoA dehydrogenase family protein [Candidatus Aminicenantes bacterium]
MDFLLTQEQEILKDSIKNFAEKEIRTRIKESDAKGEWPEELTQKLGDMGLLGIVIPPEYSGAGYSNVDYVIILEEISKVDPSVGLVVAAHNSLCSNHINLFGNEEQKKKYLTRLASGQTLGAWGLTEPEAGSDAAALKTRAVKDGNDWVLNGTKRFITNGSLAEIHVVMAITDPEKGRKGISAFILEKGIEGFKPGKKEDKLGIRSADTSELIFEDVRVPAENMLGEEGSGYRQAMAILDGGRVSIAGFSLGIAAGALEASLKYAKERVQFNRPIADFQAIQWMLADGFTELEAARLLTYRAAYLEDQGKKIPKESAMAKLFASELAVKASSMAVQIFGGYGFIKEYPVEKFYRDSKLATIGEGTSEIQRWIVAQKVLDEY